MTSTPSLAPEDRIERLAEAARDIVENPQHVEEKAYRADRTAVVLLVPTRDQWDAVRSALAKLEGTK